jgi:peptidoglycan-associated lipoprotein
MGKFICTAAMVFVGSVALLTASGCGKKSLQSGGEAQSSQQGAAAKGGTGGSDSARSGVGSNFPDTSLQSGGGSGGGLMGLDKNPSEERLGGGGGGTIMAKADTSGSASRQLDDMRAEQAASAAAGLRDVFFGYDSWSISEEGRQALVRDAEWLKANPAAAIKIEGHCDERGTSAYNLVLGEKRAKSVRNYLVELGVSANRLSVVSYGKERPFCEEHAETCYQQNRRGHLTVKAGK